MAIRTTFTDDVHGLTVANAHWVIGDPVMQTEQKRVVLRLTVYASKTAKDQGRAPLTVIERSFDAASDYDALRAVNLAAIEPELINRFFPGGTVVAD